MLEKLLNKIGLYTKEQYLILQADLKAFKERNGYLRLTLDAKEDETNRLLGALKASEEAKARVIEENKKLRKDEMLCLKESEK